MIEDGMKLEYERFIDKIPYSFRLNVEFYRDVDAEKEQ